MLLDSISLLFVILGIPLLPFEVQQIVQEKAKSTQGSVDKGVSFASRQRAQKRLRLAIGTASRCAHKIRARFVEGCK
jgi:hypothetical protein